MAKNKIGRNDPCHCGSGKKYKYCHLPIENSIRPAMPIRPEQHELETEATRFVVGNLPAAWTHEEVQRDYGKDIRVELFNNHEATAMEFFIQSKGHKKLNIVRGDQIAQELRVSTLNYFDRHLVPCMVVAYGAQEKKAYYLWIQPYIRAVLDTGNPNWRQLPGDSTITLHVPLANSFDGTAHADVYQHVETEWSRLLLQQGGLAASLLHSSSQGRRLAFSPRLLHPKIGSHLSRPRLTSHIQLAVKNRAMFLHTDAGYGKTWLVTDTVQTVTPSVVIWYTFSLSSTEPMQFIEEVASELERETKVESRTVTYMNDRGKVARADEALAILLDDFRSWGKEIWLILEDLHEASDSLGGVVETILAARLENVRLVLTSRNPLPFGQMRYVAQQALQVLTEKDLAFHPAETKEYFADYSNLSLSDEQVAYLHSRTEGWIAAIGLVGDALAQKSDDRVTTLLERLSGYGGNIYSFFAEEVYQGLTADQRFLLKRVSLVNEIDPPIVNLFTGRVDGGQTLKDLIGHNTFLIESENAAEQYRVHSLFSEFLRARFRDEEGSTAVKEAHKALAIYFSEARNWYRATEHAIEAERFDIAVQGLEITAPIALAIGFGHAVLETMDKIPESILSESAMLLETKGQAALQIGNTDLANDALHQAQQLYEGAGDKEGANRIRFLLAEVGEATDTLSTDDYFQITQEVALESYRFNNVLFAVQVELGSIEAGQRLSIRRPELFSKLLTDVEQLIVRIQNLGGQYKTVLAHAFAAKAHLTFQVLTTSFMESIHKVNIRERLGHPVPLEERVAMATSTLNRWDEVVDLYQKACSLAKEQSEIEYAILRVRFVRDWAHHKTMVRLATLKSLKTDEPIVVPPLDEKERSLFHTLLATLQEAVNIFAQYHLDQALASTLYEAATLYDMLGDLENRNRLASEALRIAESNGLTSIALDAQKILRNEGTITALREKIEQDQGDKHLALLDENARREFAEQILVTFQGDADIDAMRAVALQDADDIVAAAKQRVEWCKYVQIIQDLRHTRSMDTFYRTMPKKFIVCELLGYESIRAGSSFDELWPAFKAFYCLGCLQRRLDP